MVQNPRYTLDQLRRELELTIPVCTNCHKILHWRRKARRRYENGPGITSHAFDYLKKPLEIQHTLNPVAAWSGWAKADWTPQEWADFPMSDELVKKL